MNGLEAKIMSLESELKKAHQSSMTEKDLTIEQLQEHIRALEQHLYKQELCHGQNAVDPRSI